MLIAAAEVLCPACAAALPVAFFLRELADAEVEAAVVAAADEPLPEAACAVAVARPAEGPAALEQADCVAAPVPGLFPDDYSEPADSALDELALDDCWAAPQVDDHSASEAPPVGCSARADSAADD